MRIDSHTHAWSKPQELKSPKRYRALCAKGGIDAIVLISRPEEGLYEAARRFGDFIIPVCTVEMDRIIPQDIHRALDLGAKGIKFINPMRPYRDERYHPLYQAIKERDAVAVFHTGYLMHAPNYDNPRYRAGMDDMRATHIDTILRWVPHLKVLIAHYGNPSWEECWKVTVSHPTVYADLSGGTAIHRSFFLWKELFAPNGKLSEASLEKLCFGTDLGYLCKEGTFNERIQAYIDFYEKLFAETGASPALREKVNAGNIRKLFNLK